MIFASPDQRKMCSTGGWQTATERGYKDWFLETNTVEARSSCNKDPNHMEIPGLLLHFESVGTLLKIRVERKHSTLRGVPASGAILSECLLLI